MTHLNGLHGNSKARFLWGKLDYSIFSFLKQTCFQFSTTAIQHYFSPVCLHNFNKNKIRVRATLSANVFEYLVDNFLTKTSSSLKTLLCTTHNVCFTTCLVFFIRWLHSTDIHFNLLAKSHQNLVIGQIMKRYFPSHCRRLQSRQHYNPSVLPVCALVNHDAVLLSGKTLLFTKIKLRLNVQGKFSARR